MARQQGKKTKRDIKIYKKEKGKEIQKDIISEKETSEVFLKVSNPNISQEDSRFSETKVVTKYERWVKNRRKIMSSNIVKPLIFEDGSKSILSNFASLRWQNLLIIHKEFFPDLIYKFYANSRKLDKNEEGNQWYASKVNSMEFKFDEALFCQIVEVEDSGVLL